MGCLIFIVTFFGCCGAIKESYCMTMTFSVLLALVFLLEFGAGIAAYMLRNDVSNIFLSSPSFLLNVILKLNNYIQNVFTLTEWFLLKVDTIIEGNMSKSMMNYGEPNYDGVTRTWNMVQHEVIIVKVLY